MVLFSIWLGATSPVLLRRSAFCQLIELEYGIKLHIRSVGKYLARWGFTPQKPNKRAYEQNPERVMSYFQDRRVKYAA